MNIDYYKTELYILARENGFNSCFDTDYLIPIKSVTCHYFLLCEIQKWLMINHNIFVRTGYGWNPLTKGNEHYGYNYFIEDINKQDDKEKFNEYLQRGIIVEGHSFDTNDDAIEAGLIQAFKLLKIINKLVI